LEGAAANLGPSFAAEVGRCAYDCSWPIRLYLKENVMRVHLLFSMAALLGLVLSGCAASGAGSTQTDVKEAVLKGTVSYRERIALPADAVVEVRLSDVSRQDVAAPVIAETTVLPEGRQVPIPFELRYEPGKIDSNRTYALRATIRSAGRMMFTTTTAYRVMTQGNPTQVNLMLERVVAGPNK
jgi:putative lipoprotein